MIGSVRERIVAAAVAALDGLVRVHRYRSIPLDMDELPSIVVYPVQEASEQRDKYPVTMHQLTLRCECRAYGDPVDQKLDHIVSHVVRKLMTDSTLWGLVQKVEEQSKQWDAAPSERILGGCAVDFLITYPTASNDPETSLAQ